MGQRSRVAGGDVDRVRRAEVVPTQRVGRRRGQPVAQRDDRAFAGRVDQGERAPAPGVAARGGANVDAHRCQLPLGSGADVVVADRGEERGRAGQLRELHRGDGPAASRHLPLVGRVGDATGRWHGIDVGERDPFGVAHDRGLHRRSLPPSVCLTTCRRNADSPRSATVPDAGASSAPTSCSRSWGRCSCRGCRPRCWWASTRATTPRSGRWTRTGPSSPRSTSSRRSWTTRTTGAASQPRTRCRTCTRWAARRSWP